MLNFFIKTIGMIIHLIFRFLKQLEYKYQENEIRRLAFIDKTTKFGQKTTIQNFQHNPQSIVIGKNCYLGNTSFIVFKNGGKIEIGDYTFLNDNTKIWAMENIKIGDRVLMSYNVTLIDNNSHPIEVHERHRHCLDKFANVKIEKNPIIIEDDVWIGANSIILKGVHVGRGSIIGAGSVVSRNIPEFCIAAGNPARIIKKI